MAKAQSHSRRNKDVTQLPLTVKELQHAATFAIKATQATTFKDEIKLPSRAKEVKDLQGRSTPRNATSLQKLNLFLDQDGIVRVGVQIWWVDLKDETKSVILLPRDGHIMKLLVQHFHEVCLHQGRMTTLNEIRSNGYWIIGGTSSFSCHILSCVRSHKIWGSTQSQKMLDLPKDRLHQTPLFTYCALDYF